MRPHGSAAELERRRRLVVELLARGELSAVICRILGVAPKSLWRWSRLAEAGALGAKPHSGRPPKLTGLQCRDLENLLLQGATKHAWPNNLWTGGRVRDVIRRHFGVDYNPRYVCNLLKRRLRWSSQVPEHQKTSTDDQEVEVQRWSTAEFPRIVRDAVARGAWLAFVDETEFMLDPTVRRTYAPRGKTPVHKIADIHSRISVIGAILVSAGHDAVELMSHFLPDNVNFGGAAVAQFVGVLHGRYCPLTLVWDQTAIHDCRAVDRYVDAHPDVVVEPLPTYAPKLNPADGIWRYVKYGRLANYTPPALDQLRTAVETELDRLRGLPELLKSFIRFTKLPLEL